MNPARKILLGGAVFASTIAGGAMGATFLGTAGAATTGSTTAAATATAAPHSANGITETPLSGTDLEKATAAAEAELPGATIQRAETDAEGAAYEVHVTKADGTEATVKLDSSFKVTSVEAGRA